jgi:PPE-repeat protein
MQQNSTYEENSEDSANVGTVASAVLTSFFDALAKTDDLAEIAANLKKIVLDDNVFAEPAVRAALFPDAP